MTPRASYLLVRAGHRRVGLPITQVIGVVEPGRVYTVPAVESAVRGVATVRGQIVPVIHLGAFLDGGTCPAATGSTGVLVAVDGCRVCLEVEEADSVSHEPGLPVPSGTSLPWAVAVVQHGGGLVPLLDLTALAGALSGASAVRLSEVQPV